MKTSSFKRTEEQQNQLVPEDIGPNLERKIREKIHCNEHGDLEFEVTVEVKNRQPLYYKKTVPETEEVTYICTAYAKSVKYNSYRHSESYEVDENRIPPVEFLDDPAFWIRFEKDYKDSSKADKHLYPWDLDLTTAVNALVESGIPIREEECENIITELVKETPGYKRRRNEARLNLVLSYFVPIEIERLSTNPVELSLDLLTKRQRFYNQLIAIAEELGYSGEKIATTISDSMRTQETLKGHDFHILPIVWETVGYDLETYESYGKRIPYELRERMKDLFKEKGLPIYEYWNYSQHESESAWGLDLSKYWDSTDEEVANAIVETKKIKEILKKEFPEYVE